MSDSPLDRLWKEYGNEFTTIDDLTLARWMSQTLSQLQGRAWRLSHPLVGLYRLLSQLGHERGVWLKRLASVPAGYPEASCCRSPLLPLFSRDVLASGLICQHCGETAIAFDDLPPALAPSLRSWCEEYGSVHDVAHWEDAQRQRSSNYEEEFDRAASKSEVLLATARDALVPELLEHYPTLLWEDHDECLEVRPEDLAE